MSLRFTDSKDGRPRATIVVRHRVGRDALALAAALLLDEQIAGRDYTKAAIIAATLMSRRAVEGKLRELLSAHGDDWGLAADESTYAWADGEWDRLAELGVQIAEDLYPEPIHP